MIHQGRRQSGEHRIGEGCSNRRQTGFAPHVHDQRLLPTDFPRRVIAVHGQHQMGAFGVEIDEPGVDMNVVAGMAVLEEIGAGLERVDGAKVSSR